VVGDVEMDGFTTVVSKDQESEEQVEGQGGDNEEIDGNNVANMRVKEGAPRGGRGDGRRMYLATVSPATA
jgi:hypothetical protein